MVNIHRYELRRMFVLCIVVSYLAPTVNTFDRLAISCGGSKCKAYIHYPSTCLAFVYEYQIYWQLLLK